MTAPAKHTAVRARLMPELVMLTPSRITHWLVWLDLPLVEHGSITAGNCKAGWLRQNRRIAYRTFRSPKFLKLYPCAR